MTDRDADLTTAEQLDALAAEYVLGLDDAERRAELGRRVEKDPAFAALVQAWEQRLSAMDQDFEAVEVPSSLKTKIDKALDQQPKPGIGNAARLVPNRQRLWSNLNLWRALALGGVAAAVLLGLNAGMFNRTAAPSLVTTLITVGAEDTSPARLVALFQPDTGELRLTFTEGFDPAMRDFELWVINGEGTPESLGLVERLILGPTIVRSQSAGLLIEGATLAVSVEPVGGSPGDLPTGPVVATQKLQAI